MSILSDYNPLKTIWLPGAEISDPNGIIVVVGPNSSGKTLFLRDIENYLLSGDPKFVVCEGIAAEKPADLHAFIDNLVSIDFLRYTDDNKKAVTRNVLYVGQRGNDDPNSGQTPLQNLQQSYDNFVSERNGRNPTWFKPIGPALFVLLSLDMRRQVCSSAARFNWKESPPKFPLQGLFLNSNAQEQLAHETGNIFGNTVWLDISGDSKLQLRVSGGPTLPHFGQMTNPSEATKFLGIEREGDGYQSYVGICLSLLFATRPVALIDEPELCLHPPQAYHIGRFIGANAKENHATFVATHSSHVLRGILDSKKKVTIIRLTKQKGEFRSRVVTERELTNAIVNPRNRAEAVLDGLFSKGVILVESEGDRDVYQVAAERTPNYPSREVHFLPVGGTGGFAGPLQFYRTLNIPTAVIADLDAICDPKNVEAVYKVVSPTPNDPTILIGRVRDLVQKIKRLPPTISELDVRTELLELSEKAWDWSTDGDNLLRRRLNELEGKLKRLRKVKEGGLTAYESEPDIQSLLRELVDELACVGIFLVPVGELEDWVKPLMADVSISNSPKTEWAAIAATRLRISDTASQEVFAFLEKVLVYLDALADKASSEFAVNDTCQ